MSLVSLQNAVFDFGRERILAGGNLSLFAGVKYALVGDNGAGKTTLLALIAGEMPLHGGARQIAGRLTMRWLRQETTFDPEREGGGTLLDTVMRAAFAPELALEGELAAVARQIERAADGEVEALARQQGQLQAEYERRQGYTARARLEAALLGLGLAPGLWSRTLGELSGGERRRAALAAVLLAGGDLLLLDEATNHLDLAACEWLEEHLARSPAAAVIVSHDRRFLDRTTTRTVHLAGGKLTVHSGNYSFFVRARAEQERQERAAWERQQERFRRVEEFIRRNLAGQKTKQAQSRRRMLAKEERLERPSGPPPEFVLRLRPERESGAEVLEVEDLAKGYDGRLLWSGFSLRVARGERIGIVGPNGCGKSTLLRVLAGREPPDRGALRIGHGVDIGSYDQHLRTVSDARTVLEEIADADPAASLGELRGSLAAFGFGSDMLDRSVSALSGGERGRLALLRLVKEGHNTLLLDEPTNHLDARRREALEEGLAGFPGTQIVVSHDRAFLDRLVERLLVIVPDAAGDGRIEDFPGNYTAWRDHQTAAVAERPLPAGPPGDGGRRRASAAAGADAPAPDRGPTALSKNELARRRLWLARVEDEVAGLEREREDVAAALARPSQDAERLRSLAGRLDEIEAALAQKLALWEKWGREVEGSADS